MYRGRGRIFGGRRNECLVPPLPSEFRGTLFHPRINEGIRERRKTRRAGTQSTIHCRINQRSYLNIHMSAHWRNLSDRLSENPGWKSRLSEEFRRLDNFYKRENWHICRGLTETKINRQSAWRIGHFGTAWYFLLQLTNDFLLPTILHLHFIFNRFLMLRNIL